MISNPSDPIVSAEERFRQYCAVLDPLPASWQRVGWRIILRNNPEMIELAKELVGGSAP